MTFRLTAIAILLLGLGPGVAIEIPHKAQEHHGHAVPMRAADGKSYLVEPGETLASSMTRGSVVTSQSEPEKGACVPEGLEKKPADSVACKCYEVTECKGNEARECKRHCRKDLCHCCDI